LIRRAGSSQRESKSNLAQLPGTCGSCRQPAGAGAVVDLPGRVDLAVEAVPLGEQGLMASAGFTF